MQTPSNYQDIPTPISEYTFLHGIAENRKFLVVNIPANTFDGKYKLLELSNKKIIYIEAETLHKQIEQKNLVEYDYKQF